MRCVYTWGYCTILSHHYRFSFLNKSVTISSFQTASSSITLISSPASRRRKYDSVRMLQSALLATLSNLQFAERCADVNFCHTVLDYTAFSCIILCRFQSKPGVTKMEICSMKSDFCLHDDV